MNQQELEILQGTVASVVFQNYDNGYTVLRLQVDGGEHVTVVGTIPLPAVGERLMVTGHWSSHASYGRQFEAEFLERLMPQTPIDIVSYLSSRIIKGIGPRLAARIVNKFGDQTLVIMEREPERLAEISGISDRMAQEIGEAFRLQVGMRNLMEFFTLHHLPADLAMKTYKRFGESAIDLLYDDPYLLMDEELEAPFGAVDRFAIDMGIAAEDPRRIDAGILFELRYNLTAGHSFLPKDKLIAATAQLLEASGETVQERIQRLLTIRQLVQDHLADMDIIYLPHLYRAETYCTRRLLAHSTIRYPAPMFFDKRLQAAAKSSSLEYSPQQELALREAATSGLLLITGGPGTGKTTTLNGILSLLELLGLKCLLCAPTGRAAKRLTEVTGRDASTIHRLLGAGIDPKTGKLTFTKDDTDPLQADVVIVDEMSMVDVTLLDNLLRAVPEDSRLILVGDPDQLPPVGPGFPFSDMLRSNMLPTVRLTEIFRQAQESLIVMNAHRINRGELPVLDNVKSDFFFLAGRSEEHTAQTVVDLCARRLPQNMGIPADQIQVLCPTKKGPTGTVALNKLLQASLNPPAEDKQEHKMGDIIFREGDRVMQIRNNYDLMWKKTDGSQLGEGVFNGDVGIIRRIDKTLEMVTVLFDDREADYDFTQLNELEPAYAMTVHKSQGSEYRAVILSAWNASSYLLSRSILYTAITRARNLLIIAGRKDTVFTMTENAKTGRRYTGLKLRLQQRGEV